MAAAAFTLLLFGTAYLLAMLGNAAVERLCHLHRKDIPHE